MWGQKVNTPSISNGEFYHNTRECFHFIPIHKNKSYIYTQQLSCYPFFFIAFTPLHIFCLCVESSSSSLQKATKEKREGWKQPACRWHRKHADWLPRFPTCFLHTWRTISLSAEMRVSGQPGIYWDLMCSSLLPSNCLKNWLLFLHKKICNRTQIKCCYSSINLVRFSHLLPYLT